MAEYRTASLAAMGIDLTIALGKFTAAAITGSSAMIAEGVHSIAHAGYGSLPGHEPGGGSPARNGQQAEEGKARNSWTSIVAVMAFTVGGAIAVYEGMRHLLRPTPPEHVGWNYAILFGAFVIESISLLAKARRLRVTGSSPDSFPPARQRGVAKAAVVLQSAVTLLGLSIATAGVYLAAMVNPVFDGIAAVAIGALLITVAGALARNLRRRLAGEDATSATLEDVRRIVRAENGVENPTRMLTMRFGADTLLLALNLRFERGLTPAEIQSCIRRIEGEIRRKHRHVKHILIDSEAMTPGPKDER
ncbi:MAG TPA: cation transporter [Terriglobia bacterium]|nr:cation transporter [Terriglobia bacterium]